MPSEEGKIDSEKEGDRGGKSEVVPVFQGDTQDVYDEPTVDPVYQKKAQILNDALQDIGMGRYQASFLFPISTVPLLWDNLWPTVTDLILTPVVYEFNAQGPYLKIAQNIGLLVGSAFWGVASDVWGRRWTFNLTLFITGVFSAAAGASPNYITLCALTAVWSIGVGGNLPVDSAVFLEFVPASHQYLLTVLSIWWAFGQLLGTMVAWPLMSYLSCSGPPSPCPASSNEGWRYFLYAMGALMMVLWFLRFFIFRLYESPKYLMSRGKDEEAVKVVHKVAAYNGKTSSLTVEHLKSVEGLSTALPERTTTIDISVISVLRRKLAVFDSHHVRPLFATRKLAYSTILLIILWGKLLHSTFGCLETRGADFGDSSLYKTYRGEIILSVIGAPGALLAGYCVELPSLGRRGTLSIFTILTGVFLFASTTARKSEALMGWNCAYSFTSNIMYGVLYAISPELFPTNARGTGDAIVDSSNRIFGVLAPVIALYTNLNTSVPIYISSAIFLVAGLISLLLPYDPRGKASL
ncbi:major facilitator superfamily domain-containing protein [Chiua virens]|nr:major facilitator superfamily domain-containing protein [Chiua virens]